MYSTKYLGGFDISKQRRVEDDTPGPIQLVPADRQRRALSLILRVVAGDGGPAGDAAFLPGEEDFSNLAMWTGLCEGLGQYCYGTVPVDVLSEVGCFWFCCRCCCCKFLRSRGLYVAPHFRAQNVLRGLPTFGAGTALLPVLRQS